MKLTITFEIEVSDIPEKEREEIIADSGMDDEDMPRIAEMSEEEVRSEIIGTFYSMFNGADYDVQSEMWAGSDFYGYITGISVRETLPPAPREEAR